MALEVDITKKLDGFFMHMQFRAEQEIFAILGASGCGKSMTLKSLTARCCLIRRKKSICRRRSGKSAICSRITPCFRI